MKNEDEQAELERIEKLARINRAFASHIPFNNALGIQLEEVGPGFATQYLPVGSHLVGDPARGTMHGGVITTLLDSCCGAAVFMALEKPAYMATLDLRIDFLRPADARRPLHSRADCHQCDHQLAFVRCVAWQDDPDNPVAVGSATFAIGTPHGLPGARKPT